MPFFDFHVHPTMKSLFTDAPNKLSPWEKLNTRMIPDLLRCCTEFKYILQSQASLTQLWYNECRLICVALHVPERNMLNNNLILGQADGKLKNYLNKEKILKIISGELSPYQVIINDDLKTLFDAKQFGIEDRQVVALNNAADYDETRKDTIYVVFSIEGCHTLSSSLVKLDVAEIISRLTDLAKQVPLIAVNLTHLEQSVLCNHAFGMLFIANEAFKPKGFGLSAGGMAVIKHCYTQKIAIDLKHMSLGARQQLYGLRKSAEFLPINQPLLCTHAGFTGISYSQIPDYIYNVKAMESKGYTLLYQGKPWLNCKGIRPSFNSSSINLYDEDILQILKSDGIIGISLDKRILGYIDPDGKLLADQDQFALEIEYISVKEHAFFFTSNKTGGAFGEGRCIENSEVGEAGRVNPGLEEYHLRHFMAHIIHLIKVVQNDGYSLAKALQQVCIGSDYDGLINPVWVCDTVDEFVYFKERFEKSFLQFARDCNVMMPDDFDTTKFAMGLFYENGKNFVLQRLTG
jgi:microsomal dipeptidase-like Zn-dependent dipeptidase